MISDIDKWYEERRSPDSKKEDDDRDEYERDYSRLIHAASFRRLQNKTQILNLGDGDFYRTRLTHTLEVASIATGIFRRLEKDKNTSQDLKQILKSQALIQAVCLAHDIGHPPFGHGGETALNYCMLEYGGFEGNGQSLRLLTKLEKSVEGHGLNLTRRTLLGILKYPVAYSVAIKGNKYKKQNVILPNTSYPLINTALCKPPKCYLDEEQKIVDWLVEGLSSKNRDEFFKTRHKNERVLEACCKTFDCSVMDLADDIAYGVHDLEDAIALGLVSKEEFLEDVEKVDFNDYLEHMKSIKDKTFETINTDDLASKLVENLFSEGQRRKKVISSIVNYFLSRIEIEDTTISEPILFAKRATLSQRARSVLDALKNHVYGRVISSSSVQHLEFKGQQMVIAVFEALFSDYRKLLPEAELVTLNKPSEQEIARKICDYIAGMTDTFLLKTYERLFSPRMGSVFDRL